MNIIYLCKRQYMRKDVLDDRYGRMYEIPLELSQAGVHVSCFSLSYRSKGYFNKKITDDLSWISIDMNPAHPAGMIRLVHEVISEVEKSGSVAVVASSDILHLAIGRYVSKKTGIPLISDLYDNFESYGMFRLPFMKSLYQNALRNSAAVACVSRPLAEYVKGYCQPACILEVIENAVDTTVFKPFSMTKGRKILSLPEQAILIGTAGELSESRGIGILYRAYERLLENNPDIHLVLAGKLSDKEPLPENQSVHFLGELDHARIADFYNALDLAVVPLTDSVFGRYCYPQKACEIVACKRPLVASSVGVMTELLAEYPGCLFDDGDVEMLAEKILHQLDSPVIPEIVVQSWAEQSAKMKQLIDKVVYR